MQPDELYKICCVMGTPTAATWPEGLQLAQQVWMRVRGAGSTGRPGGLQAHLALSRRSCTRSLCR